jgi:uncharacterized protein
MSNDRSFTIQSQLPVNGSPPASALHPPIAQPFWMDDRSMNALAVRTLTGPDFATACAELMQQVELSYAPTLLIGVRTGGLVVAEAMAGAVAGGVPVAPLTCRRAATGAKARLPFLARTLSALPRPVTDTLRVAELRLSAGRRRARAPAQAVDQVEAEAIAARVRAGPGGERLLVVDDAVDSGVTLGAVLRVLRGLCPEATEIRSAVVTVTLDSPLVQPDFALHRGVLCRFPWSFDVAH